MSGVYKLSRYLPLAAVPEHAACASFSATRRYPLRWARQVQQPEVAAASPPDLRFRCRWMEPERPSESSWWRVIAGWVIPGIKWVQESLITLNTNVGEWGLLREVALVQWSSCSPHLLSQIPSEVYEVLQNTYYCGFWSTYLLKWPSPASF